MAAGNICYYKKFGHCRFLETCKYRHIETICETKECEIVNCERRHPKECRYFKEFSRCKFGDYCSFRHETTLNEGNVTLVKEVETLKERVDHLEKLIEDKDKQIKEIHKNLLNLVKSEDKNVAQPLVIDEIMLESIVEGDKVIEKTTSTARPTFKCDKCSKYSQMKLIFLTTIKLFIKLKNTPVIYAWKCLKLNEE